MLENYVICTWRGTYYFQEKSHLESKLSNFGIRRSSLVNIFETGLIGRCHWHCTEGLGSGQDFLRIKIQNYSF